MINWWGFALTNLKRGVLGTGQALKKNNPCRHYRVIINFGKKERNILMIGAYIHVSHDYINQYSLFLNIHAFY